MGQLYLEVYSVAEEGWQAEVPIQSAISFFLLTYLQHPSGVTVNLVLTESASETVSPSLSVCLRSLQHRVIKSETLGSPVSDCCLPVFVLNDTVSSCVAGLCAVLRQVVKYSGEEWRHLLGFREGCLFACAEVSLWTKFCEIDVVEVVEDILLTRSIVGEDIQISEHLARLEEHLKQPVRMHNVDKLRKQTNQDSVNHDFAEGHAISLADLIIVPCVNIFLQVFYSEKSNLNLPFLLRWHKLVISQEYVTEALKVIEEIPSQVKDLADIHYHIPDVPIQSLYKSDPKRYKPKTKQFTRQEDVDAALRVVDNLVLDLNYNLAPFGHEIPLDWEAIPVDVQPDVPLSRLTRKQQQLENLSKAVIKVARPGDTIVDFCCGSGHLGLVVAYYLPQCRIILLDNKEESLARAKSRVSLLGLSNVTTIQSNLDYFKGSFQVGMSLHACGVASDLVIQTCLQRNAAFVVCPCCYGSLQNNHMVSYPRSAGLSPVSLHFYLVLGHCADQTHKQLYSKSAQGERCMAIIDYDRCQLAKEKGYSVSLAKLIPLTCSPKNNLLVGIPDKYSLNVMTTIDCD